MKIIECVPNVSEGRNRQTLDAIAAAIRGVDGVTLLDMDPGAATNRTVFTFVGSPEAVEEAAFRTIATAARLVDMSKHHGEHPRMGATDVCPFVPVSGATMDDCAEIARRLGSRVGEELGIPVYLYEHAATTSERRNLADVRKGEYEALPEKLRDAKWRPDYGPAEFNARAGATAIGARQFLIAYNVNLNTRNKKLAHDIAIDIREMGRAQRGPDGKFLRDESGEKVREPGRFEGVKAVGWYIDEYRRAQISMNITDFTVSPVHEIFDAICEEAEKRGLRVTGSELVGLIPLEALLSAGRHYLRKQDESTGVPEEDLVDIAIQSLGLADLGPFDPEEKVIEHRTRRPAPLAAMDLRAFTKELASDSPAPGGGSVAALCGALGASLAAMVAHLTYAKRKTFAEKRPLMNEIAEKAHALRARFLHAIDADTDAFNAVIDARRMPKSTDEEIAARDATIREAERGAIGVPFGVLDDTIETIAICRRVAEEGNPASLSDAGVGGLVALACAEGAYYNVLINLGGNAGAEFDAKMRADADDRIERARRDAEALRRQVIESLTSEG
jgi:glutamate formiminotransferase/formiminotetrahydrofolate cyclodeaminase